MCRLYDNSWFVTLELIKLGVIALAMLWLAYRSGAFASLNRWRRQAVAELALDEAPPQDAPLAA
jgi:hypothetical protein